MSYSPIPNNLSLPAEIRTAREDGDLTLFIGAGISASMGCLTWEDLTAKLVYKCHEKGFIKFPERDYLLDQNNKHKCVQTLSSCYDIFDKNHDIQDFYDVAVESCHIDPARPSDFCLNLKRLANFFITTNYDDGFDRYFSKNEIIFEPKDFERMGKLRTGISSGKLYHIHGSVINPRTMVLTETDYANKYTFDFQQFLLDVFAQHSLLFIGYGFEEEIIKYLFLSAKQYGHGKKHFILKHYYSPDTLTYKQEKQLFGTAGVEVISYIGDDFHYEEMIAIIESWGKDIERPLVI